MFRRIDQYDLIEAGGRWFRPRAYGDVQADGTWDGWLVFFPLGGGPAIASNRETTQSSAQALTKWAANLTRIYLQGALARALRLSEQPPLITQLADAEYDALEDAEIAREAAQHDRAAAVLADAEADRLRRERLAAEGALAATEEAAARMDAEVREQAARDSRAVATDAARRGRDAAKAAQTRRSRKASRSR